MTPPVVIPPLHAFGRKSHLGSGIRIQPAANRKLKIILVITNKARTSFETISCCAAAYSRDPDVAVTKSSLLL